MPTDVTGFLDDSGLKFNPKDGEAFYGHAHYVDGKDEPVVEYEPTGFTFLVNSFVVGPDGVNERAGIGAFASLFTAGEVAKFISKHFGFKTVIQKTEWLVYKVVDSNGHEVPQYQIHSFDEDKPKEVLNAGLVAGTLIRNSDEFAAKLIKEML